MNQEPSNKPKTELMKKPNITGHILLILTTILFLTNSAKAQNKIYLENAIYLREVQLKGIDKETETFIRSEIDFPINEPLTEQVLIDINDDLEALDMEEIVRGMELIPVENAASQPTSKPNERQTVSLTDEPKQADLEITFFKMPKVSSIEVFSLIEVSSGKFEDAITLGEGIEYSEELEKRTIEELRTLAREEEFNFVTITPHHHTSEEGGIDIGFIVEGRAPAELYKVRFKDAGWGNAVKIRRVLKDPEFVGFDQGSRVTAKKLQEVETVVGSEIMRAMGYLTADVRLERTELTDKGAKVNYRVYRGERFDIDSIVVNGQIFPDHDFWDIATARFAGKNFTSSNLEELEESIRRKSRREDYIEPTIDFEMGPGEEPNTVAIVAKVDEGNKANLGSLRIRRRAGLRGYGDTFYHKKIAPPMKDEIIERQFRLEPGEPITLRKLEDAERRLWRLGVFDEVNLTTEATTDTLVRDLVADLRERRTAALGISVGWNDDLGPVIRGQMRELNIGGRGDIFSIDAYAGIEVENFGGSVAYTDRYWKLGEKLLGYEREPSLTYFAQYNERGYDEYIERVVGGRIRLQYLVGENKDVWSHFWELRAEDINFDPFQDEDNYAEDFQDYVATTVAFGVEYDNRNRGDYESTEGLKASSSLEVGQANEFLIKWSNEFEYHKPLSQKFAYELGGELGLMPYDAEDIGLAERFHAGGTDSIRGFDVRGVGPVDRVEEGLRIGGTTLTSLQNEIRYAVAEDIDIPIFLDMATLEDEFLEVGPLRATTGIGLRVKLPDSSQRAYIYYAEHLLSESTDDDRSVHFGFKFDL